MTHGGVHAGVGSRAVCEDVEGVAVLAEVCRVGGTTCAVVARALVLIHEGAAFHFHEGWFAAYRVAQVLVRLFQILEVWRVWDVAALFWFAVAFIVGVAVAGCDHSGSGAFLDDVVDHVLLSLSVISAHTLVWGVPYALIVSRLWVVRLLVRYLFSSVGLLRPVGESRVRLLVGCPVFVIVRVFSSG